MTPFRKLSLLICSLSIGIASLSATEFYVSPVGDDRQAGTEAAPWKSWAHAQQRVREWRTTHPLEPITIYFAGGVYRLENPIVLTAEDSGSAKAPIRYKAMEGEAPIFSGSVVVKNWSHPISKAPAEMDIFLRLQQLPNAYNTLYVADLNQEGVTDFGDPTDLGKRPELFCNKELQTLARWPNMGMTQAGSAMGSTDVGPNWANFIGYREGIFQYLGEQPARWIREPDARLGGYWFWDWREEFQRVKRVDPSAHLIYTREPYHTAGYKNELRYFGLNLLCELDSPTEWYLDRNSGLLYWYPPVAITPQTEVTLSVNSAPYLVELHDCSYITLEGLSFEESRGSGILIEQGNNCTIMNCRVERMGRDGIHVMGGNEHTLSGSLLRTLGCGGIRLVGGDRKTLTPANHRIEHTIVDEFSLFKRTYEPAVYAEGCGLTISHNRFTRSSSSAMRLEGNDMVVEYNQISAVVNESDDQGGMDMWYNPSYQGVVIRYNHWSDIVGGTHCGAAGVRLDDLISGVLIYGNVFERSGSHNFGGVQINGGKDNLVDNNLFWSCQAAVSWYENPWDQKRWDQTVARAEVQKKIYDDVDIRSELYLSRYPKLAQIHENACSNTISNNLLVDCGQLFIAANERQTSFNNHLIRSSGRTLEMVCTPEVLKEFGLEPIPLQEMGPRDNPWLFDPKRTEFINSDPINPNRGR